MAEAQAQNKPQSKARGRADAVVMLLATVGVAVLVNALATQTSVRLDLTEQKVHTLSEASKAAARALDGVTVTAYVSKKLPESIPTPQGGKLLLKGAERAFRDKLEEYAVASGGTLRIVWADDNSPGVGTIEEQAEAAKLEPFSSTEAQLTGGELKFARYVMGATFHYRNVHEVLPKALNSPHLEFEITKILLRLKEKYDNSQLMKEPLAQGKALHDGVKTCNDAVQKAAKVDEAAETGAGLSLQGVKDPGAKRIEALKAARPDLDKACAPVAALLDSEGKKLKGKNQFGDHVLENATQFAEVWGELKQTLEQPEGAKEKGMLPPAMAVSQLVQVMDQLQREVDRAHTNLTDSPGRKVIGFLCGHDEFCPFGEKEPFVQEQMAMMMAQNNPMMKQIVQAATQIAQAVDETNARIGDGLFTRQGYAIRRVEAEEPIPADVSALIVYAPRKPLEEYTRYQLDQFLLSGRPVAVFAQEWQVALQNMAPAEDVAAEMRTDFNGLLATNSNLADVLKPYGVELGKELVLDTKHVERVRVTQLISRGGLQFQTQKDFPYALIPVATQFDKGHPLTRALQNLPFPVATTAEPSKTLAADKRFEVVPLIRSSESSVKKAAPLPVQPLALKEEVPRLQANGPHTLALYVRGPFKSAYAGKDLPKRPEKKAPDDPMNPKPADKPSEADAELEKRRFKTEGNGKLLVVASNLGIEGLSRKDVLKGFDLAKLAQFSADTIKDYQTWNANFQNWQIRIGQVSHLLSDNLRFLTNVLDWQTAHEALVDIRSKGEVRRPLQEIEADQARQLRLGTMMGAPALLIVLGLLRWRMRRNRFAALKL